MWPHRTHFLRPAQCKTFDTPTPSYLIPYYLKNVHSHFRHYASVKKGNEVFMTVEDLVSALLALPSTVQNAAFATPKLRALFEATDEDKDGCISFSEFRVLSALLQLPSQDIPVLFRLADKDRKGALTLEQFALVLYGSTEDMGLYHSIVHPRARQNGLLNRLFQHSDNAFDTTCGERDADTEDVTSTGAPVDAAPRCTEADVRALVEEIEEQLWEADFRRFSVGDGGGSEEEGISASKFIQLLASHVVGTHPPYYLEGNIKKLQRGSEHYPVVTLSVWIAFNRIMKAAEEVSGVFSFLTSTGNSVSRENINLVLQVAGLDGLPESVTDILFAVFDKNGDGKIDLEECLSVVGQRRRVYYRSPFYHESRTSVPHRVMHCSADLAEKWKTNILYATARTLE